LERIERTRSVIMDAGGLHPHKELEYKPSQLMKDVIRAAENDHCFGCDNDPTIYDIYLKFLLSPYEPILYPRLKNNSTHH
jgi:hypothetical protein